MPEGLVNIAPHVSITFSKPMIALGSVDETEQNASQIASIIPAVPSFRWRWLGCQTLVYEGAERLPMSTEYTVKVSKGIESADKLGTIENDFSFKFSTPTIKLKSYEPSAITTRKPLFFVEFDQLIDPKAILETIQVVCDNKQFPIRLANQQDIDQAQFSNAAITKIKSANKPNWLSFVLDDSVILPYNSNVEVLIGPSTPSAEGPLRTTEVQKFNFNTYGALDLISHHPIDENSIYPYGTWNLNFNNQLDDETVDDCISVEPELEGMIITCSGSSLSINGRSKGRTTYIVTIKNSLKDIYGQNFEKEKSVSFKVGPARPYLYTFSSGVLVLDPAISLEDHKYSIVAVNVKQIRVTIYQVDPKKDFSASPWGPNRILNHNEDQSDPDIVVKVGKKVIDKVIDTNCIDDEPTAVHISIAEAFQHREKGLGHIIIGVKAYQADDLKQVHCSWLQSTRIAIDVFQIKALTKVWTTNLIDGQPISDVAIKYNNFDTITAQNGFSEFKSISGASNIVVAQKGDDIAMTQQIYTNYYDHDLNYLIHVIDDRHLYKPNEEVHIKGWVRKVIHEKGCQLLSLPNQIKINYDCSDSRGQNIATGDVQLNKFGAFDFNFKIKDNINLGAATIYFSGDKLSHHHNFEIQEFRTPEFKVSAESPISRKFINGSAIVNCKASYFSGGEMSNSKVNWEVKSSATSYSPPNWYKFVFGQKVNPWYYRGIKNSHVESCKSCSGLTDGQGKHEVEISYAGIDIPPTAVSIHAEASVSDVNRQTISASTNFIVHPCHYYVGILNEKSVVNPEQKWKILVVVVDIDGKVVSGLGIRVSLEQTIEKYSKGKYYTEQKTTQVINLISQDGPMEVELQAPIDGGNVLKIKTEILDEKGNKNESSFTLWMSGTIFKQSKNTQENFILLSDKDEYNIGDIAKITIQTPFYPCECYALIEGVDLIDQKQFRIENGLGYEMEILIEENWLPNVQVSVFGGGPGKRIDDLGHVIENAPPKPAHANGSINLKVNKLHKTLQVQVSLPCQTFVPGAQTVVDVSVVDSLTKQPVNESEVTLLIVDEAVLSLSGYNILLDKFFEVFYREIHFASNTLARLRDMVYVVSWNNIKLVNPDPPVLHAARCCRKCCCNCCNCCCKCCAAPQACCAFGCGDAEGANEQQQPTIAVRSNFNPLAAFAGSLVTNVEGKQSFAIKLPDNLTQYRVWAIATHQANKFGLGETNFQAQLPLMIRPSAPRFLNFGDEFYFPVVVQNQSDRNLDVNVVLRATNAEIVDRGFKVQIAANKRKEVLFKVKTINAGKARFQIGGTSGEFSDAAEINLPVWTPATSEAFATYGEIDNEFTLMQPIHAPKNVFPQFGSLEVSLSSTILQALTDAVIYIYNYPYECCEQISSRIASISALRDVLQAFKVKELPTSEQINEKIKKDLEKLKSLQHSNGGFGYWSLNSETSPFVSSHVGFALSLALKKGYSLDLNMKNELINYLTNIRSHIPEYYSKISRASLIAFSLYVRDLLDDNSASKATVEYFESEKRDVKTFTMEALGWLSMAARKSDSKIVWETVKKYIFNNIKEEAEIAHFVTSYDSKQLGAQSYLLLNSNRKTDAVLLETLLELEKENSMIVKLVKGLMAHKKKGRWGNTQECCFALVALDSYFRIFEKNEPNFESNLWLNDLFIGKQGFIGRSTETHRFNVPMQVLVADERIQDLQRHQLFLQHSNGDGRLYYRLALSYAPRNLQLPAIDCGFTVERIYESLDDAQDVKRECDGIWRVKAGARVRVRLTMANHIVRYHVALVDKLPAGFEALNPALKGTGSIPQDEQNKIQKGCWFWRPQWFEHQNLRDERVEAFTSYLNAGVHKYSYVARATTPGNFVVPPAQAEEMYSPEIFGRSISERVIILP
eukprot:TRINITY_DN683_c0_g1_i7.p1 TRINITY_DN683_c0_g1~~TRINITY_DN683_c0_g1_i7.p1  ORF type:complete len:1884 (-),score=903.40 TRINITY_DN683_c0_g1_i7:215-5866(-)